MSGEQPAHPTEKALSCDYDQDPARFAANQTATRRYLTRPDIHTDVAARFAADDRHRVVDIGGGNGSLARLLAERGIGCIVVDRAQYVADAPRPVVRADARCLPFRDNVFDGAAALWMLYHLHDPLLALREAYRVLRPGGLLAVSASSRENDPELAQVLPGWGRPLTFDAENAPALLRRVFDVVDIQHWDVPAVHLPDRAALTLYLRGRGLPEAAARTAAYRFEPPLDITKRGMLAWARSAADE